MERTILHCDCNSFFASVETVLNPDLSKVPMAVCGNPENRHGIILAKNELAKKYNIQTAETIYEAKKKCRDLVLVEPHYLEYVKYSKLINEEYAKFTDRVESFGIDESWLDVTETINLFGSGEEIANKLRKTIKEKYGLTISVGVSFNKTFAKLGSDYKKPDATTVISKENYKKIVFPLPVSDLLYVGKAANKILSNVGIRTIGDLAISNKKYLEIKLGKSGAMIHDYANGIDFSSVKYIYDETRVKSISNNITFRRDLNSYEDIKFGVITIAESVASRMYEQGFKAYTVQVMIKDENFKTISRQKTFDTPVCLTRDIKKISLDIIKENWRTNVPIRMLSIGVTNLVKEGEYIKQISLFDLDEKEDNNKQYEFEKKVFEIRKKFGNSSLKIASLMNNDLSHLNYTLKDKK